MACITLTAQPLAMATTEFVRAIHYEDVSIRGSNRTWITSLCA